MALLGQIVEGWTKEMGPFTLKVDGVALNLTGYLTSQIVLKLRPAAGTSYSTTTGDVRIDDDPTSGKVYFTPDADDFKYLRSPYSVRFQVTDADGDVVFFPSAGVDTVIVYQP